MCGSCPGIKEQVRTKSWLPISASEVLLLKYARGSQNSPSSWETNIQNEHLTKTLQIYTHTHSFTHLTMRDLYFSVVKLNNNNYGYYLRSSYMPDTIPTALTKSI